MKKLAALLSILILLSSCKNDKKDQKDSVNGPDIQVSHEVLDSTNLQACQDGNCPDVKVNLITLKGNSSLSKSFNEKNTDDLRAIFNINQDEPKAANVEDAVNGFVNDYFKFKEEYPESKASYEATVDQEIKSKNENTVVLKTSYYLFTGGAHGYGGVHFLNFDTTSGKYLTAEDIISDIPALTDFVEKKFRQKYNIPPKVDINSQGFFFDDGKFALPKNIALTDKALILLYNPYEAASYSEGQIRFVFPRKTVEEWLNY